MAELYVCPEDNIDNLAKKKKKKEYSTVLARLAPFKFRYVEYFFLQILSR